MRSACRREVEGSRGEPARVRALGGPGRRGTVHGGVLRYDGRPGFARVRDQQRQHGARRRHRAARRGLPVPPYRRRQQLVRAQRPAADRQRHHDRGQRRDDRARPRRAEVPAVLRRRGSQAPGHAELRHARAGRAHAARRHAGGRAGARAATPAAAAAAAGMGGAIFNQGTVLIERSTLVRQHRERRVGARRRPVGDGGGGIGIDAPSARNTAAASVPAPLPGRRCGGAGGAGGGGGGARLRVRRRRQPRAARAGRRRRRAADGPGGFGGFGARRRRRRQRRRRGRAASGPRSARPVAPSARAVSAGGSLAGGGGGGVGGGGGEWRGPPAVAASAAAAARAAHSQAPATARAATAASGAAAAAARATAPASGAAPARPGERGGGGAGLGGAIFNMQARLDDPQLDPHRQHGRGRGGRPGRQPRPGDGRRGLQPERRAKEVDSTFAGNTAADGGASIYNLVYDASVSPRQALATVRDTILADGTGPNDLVSDKPAAVVGGTNSPAGQARSRPGTSTSSRRARRGAAARSSARR